MNSPLTFKQQILNHIDLTKERIRFRRRALLLIAIYDNNGNYIVDSVIKGEGLLEEYIDGMLANE